MLAARVIIKFFQYLLTFAVEAKSKKEELAKNVGTKKWFSLYQPKSRWRRSTNS